MKETKNWKKQLITQFFKTNGTSPSVNGNPQSSAAEIVASTVVDVGAGNGIPTLAKVKAATVVNVDDEPESNVNPQRLKVTRKTGTWMTNMGIFISLMY